MKRNLYDYVLKKAKYSRGFFVISISLNFLIAVSMILFALFSKKIIDLALTKDTEGLINYSISLIILLVLTIIMKVFLSFTEQKFKAKLEKTIELDLYRKLICAPHLEEHSGNYLSNLTLDVEHIAEGITRFIPSIVSILTKIILSFLILIWISWILAVLIFVFALITLLFFQIIKPKMLKYSERVLKTTSKKREFFQETLENKIILNCFQKEDNFFGKGTLLAEENYQKKYQKIRFSTVLNFSVIFLFQMLQFFVLIFCAFQIVQSKLSFGDLTAILQLVGYIQSPLMNLNQLTNKYFNMVSSFNRIKGVLELEKTETPIISGFKAIEIKKLAFSYGEQNILNGVDLSLNRGNFISIIGESGCGKSTFFKVLLGLISSDSGEITVDEAKVLNLSPLIGYVPQTNLLFSGTIRDNLTLLDQIPEEEIREVLKICELEDFAGCLGENIDYLLKEKNQGISEGQAQRINIARAILQKRPILLLDESTSSLDEITEENILRALKKLNKTILFISHKNKVFKYSDFVFEMKDQKLFLREDL